MKVSMADVMSAFAVDSGTEGSIVAITFFSQRMLLAWEVEKGRASLRCVSWGERAEVERCRGREVEGGVV